MQTVNLLIIACLCGCNTCGFTDFAIHNQAITSFERKALKMVWQGLVVCGLILHVRLVSQPLLASSLPANVCLKKRERGVSLSNPCFSKLF